MSLRGGGSVTVLRALRKGGGTFLRRDFDNQVLEGRKQGAHCLGALGEHEDRFSNARGVYLFRDAAAQKRSRGSRIGSRLKEKGRGNDPGITARHELNLAVESYPKKRRPPSLASQAPPRRRAHAKKREKGFSAHAKKEVRF